MSDSSTPGTYPWSHLFCEEANVDLPGRALAQAVAQQEVVIKESAEKLQTLRDVSDATFDNMQQQLNDKDSQLDKLTLALDEHIDPLTTATMTQAVIAHGKGLTGSEAETYILKGVIQWLGQRHKVITYLKNMKRWPNECSAMETTLIIDKVALEAQARRYVLPAVE